MIIFKYPETQDLMIPGICFKWRQSPMQVSPSNCPRRDDNQRIVITNEEITPFEELTAQSDINKGRNNPAVEPLQVIDAETGHVGSGLSTTPLQKQGEVTLKRPSYSKTWECKAHMTRNVPTANKGPGKREAARRSNNWILQGAITIKPERRCGLDPSLCTGGVEM